ncbi:MAG: haloalkane dehalogenase [Chloroflexota bacterium]
MKAVRTPEARFENIPDYPFSPHFSDVGDGLQMHYVDEGPKAGKPILLMHGEPSWSFLYRKMIPVFVAKGYRVLAPDLIGFGKSSKPTEMGDYTYARHIEWTMRWFEQLDLNDVAYFGQDWGGLVGLRLVTAVPEKFSHIFVGNTGLPTGDHKMPEAFLKWQQFSQNAPHFPTGAILQNSTVSLLTDDEVAAYEAPYPDDSYMAGARIFPSLVPTTPDNAESDNNRKAWQVLAQWEKPLVTLFSDSDPITKGGERPFQKLVPGAKHELHQIIEGAGHFLQEDKGPEIAQIMIDIIEMA